MHLLLIITVIAGFFVISRIFQSFLITKSNNFANNELSKSENPPPRQSGGFGRFFGNFWLFLGSFGGYLAIFLNLVSFNHQKLIISHMMNYQNLKNRQPANLAVLGGFLAIFGCFWAFSWLFCYF